MIGRLPHPTDADRHIYVALIYRAATRDWRPLRDGYHATETEAFAACAKELTERAGELSTGHDELQINLDRLLEATGMEDVIRIGGMRHVLDMKTDRLVPAGPPAPRLEQEESLLQVLAEEAVNSLSRVRERMGGLLGAHQLEHVAVLLRKLAEEWERSEPERIPPGDAGQTA